MTAKPLLKWVGSKRAITETLIEHMPTEYGDYYEPFLGGASLFFALQPFADGKRAYLSDFNDDLITTYKAVKRSPRKLMKALDALNEDWSEEFYYALRSQHDLKDTVDRAARFIYLNRYGYNGLVRYNSKGEFNVPWGHKKKQVRLYEEENIAECSTAFKSAELTTRSYQKAKPKEGDFIYLDPPYHQNFNTYAKNPFGEEQQEELARYCQELDKRGVLFLLSNSDTPLINSLYNDFVISKITAPRFVSCRSDGRKPVVEVLISNYEQRQIHQKSGLGTNL